MDQQDLFYWAYEHYKQEFENNRENYLFKKGVNSKKAPKDVLTMVEVTCEIEEDWIAAIEKGLDYIQKAIKEDRQFIRNEGEVLPIEKIRRVNKDSIVDLSKHSNYITKLPEEGETVIPEKLMMSKRENDYSIYENRVVYTTLAYLKDFVAERLEKIKDAVNKYEGTAEIIKTIELGYRTVDVSFKVHDIRKNDPIVMEKVGAQDKIKRLDTILNGVLVLLKTPLMQEVSKAPLVTRPVTKTNVLKMNTNFKETLFIFDYVCAYNKPGFQIHEEVKEIKPLSLEQENAFSDVILLYSFLAYEYNNHIEDKLKKNYLEEVERRQKIQDDELLARIEEMMHKAKRSEKTMAEYAMLLEEGYKVLQKRIDEAKAELEKTIQEYENKITEINQAHEEEINHLNEEHENQTRVLEANLREEFANERSALITAHEEAIKVKDEEISSLNDSIEQLEDTIKEQEIDHEEEIASMEAELELAHAENISLRAAKKLINPRDYYTKERIDELEKAMNVLKSFFDKSWRYAKRDIKKKHYAHIKDKKPAKGEGGKADE